MRFLDRWLALANWLARRAIWFAGTLMLAAALLVSVDVLLRKFLLLSVGGADELSGYAFAIGTAWALAFTLLQRANVRVDALYIHLPQAACAVLDLAAMLSLGVFVGLLTWQAWVVLDTSLAFDAHATTPLQTPLFLRSLGALIRGDLADVRRLVGARSIEEDAAAEIAHTEHLEPANHLEQPAR